MKKILSLILALVLVCSLLPALPASAAEYRLWVNGTQVTSANASDILGDGGFTYSAKNNRLTIRGNLRATSDHAIENNIPGLTVYVAESVSLSSSYAALLSYADLKITGPGTLWLHASAESGLAVNFGATLTIENARISAKGTGGINGGFEGESKLVIRDSHVEAIGTVSAVMDFKGGIVLEGCELLAPEGGAIRGGAVLGPPENGAAVLATQVTIGSEYELWIADTQVTSGNAPDVLGNGVFSYDAASKTLTVQGDFTTQHNIIANQTPGLTIYVAENSSLYSQYCALIAHADCTVTGPGRLKLESEEFCAVMVRDGTDLTLENANLYLLGPTGGIWSFSGEAAGSAPDPDLPLDAGSHLTREPAVYHNHLYVRGGGLRAQGLTAAIYGFDSITLEGCELLDPEDGSISGGEIVNGQGVTASDVTIGNAYPLWIDGVQVTSLNARDVLENGAFSYDAAQKTLRLLGDYSSADEWIIYSALSGLTVRAERDVTLTGGYSAAIAFSEHLTITGPGRLTVTSSASAIVGYAGANLTIADAWVSASSEEGRAIGGSVSGEELFLQNCAVLAHGGAGAICYFDDIHLGDCEVLAPEGGFVSEGNIVDGHSAMADDVLLGKRYDLTIAGRQVTSVNAPDVLGNGVFSYDAGTNTLTVKGFYRYTLGVLINNRIPGLTVWVPEQATLQAEEHVIATSADLTISGPDLLTLRSENYKGIYVYNRACLTLNEAAVDAGGVHGIYGLNGSEKLVIRDSYVNASGSEAAISNFGGITLIACAVIVPEGGKIQNGAVTDPEGTPDTAVAIRQVSNPFTDVKPGDYFYDAVLWAICHQPQITSGTGDGKFSPKNTCTREQIVTYLWHALGDPEPASTVNPFTDVKKKHYFYKAVLWAVENGVTSGVNADTFGVGQPCTRAQAMTFLWNALGKPEPESAVNPFTDVKPGKFYYKAVLWAVENGITSGVGGGKFGVNDTCTRGQIVTFLFIALTK